MADMHRGQSQRFADSDPFAWLWLTLPPTATRRPGTPTEQTEHALPRSRTARPPADSGAEAEELLPPARRDDRRDVPHRGRLDRHRDEQVRRGRLCRPY